MIERSVGDYAIVTLRRLSPYRTGNLRYNGIGDLKMFNVNAVGFEIGGQRAPYASILNDNKTIKGNRNRHYMWIDKAMQSAVRELAQKVGGRIERS